ncbi:methionine synthase reductase [Brachyhypopomus gauderio]|uniref:methionine synthase reductase n=1 Tax=Brachyhypopomus gauderio TaxID=698409 RepID=UPI00404378B5
MPCAPTPPFLLLYGSQRGQARAIAEELSAHAPQHGLLAQLSCLSEEEKYDLDKECGPVVFVVSTTGDGEPPDTALKFVKKIKNKSLTSDHYSHVRYAFLALGDTNYANFCNCGKTIDRRLQELGAKRFYATGHADDGTGLEEVVDPWIDGLWEALKKAFVGMSVPIREAAAPGDLAQDSSLSSLQAPAGQDAAAVSLQLLKLNDADSQKAEPEAVVAHSSDTHTNRAPLAASLVGSVPPLSESSLKIPALPPPYLEVCLGDVLADEECVGVVKEGFQEVPVSRAVRLTRDDAVKTAILLELGISGENMSYQPGDAFDVWCPNTASEVEHLLQRLALQDQRNRLVHLQLRKDTKKKGAKVPSHIPQKCTLLDLLTSCLELRSIPKKAFVRALADCTPDGGEKRRLQELCSQQGAADYNSFVRDRNVCLLDLLVAFPSCKPPLSLLIEQIPALQPRPYSAASCSRTPPGRVRFVFNVVEFPACAEHPERRGLCTGWLADRVAAVLQPYGTPQASEDTRDSSTLPKVHVSRRINNTFHLPTDAAVPIVMVGPGTGVAPFIGFLQQREREREENPEYTCGETWLFFGCRHKDRDFLFREELERFVETGTLNHLKVCFSRDDPEGGGPEPRPRYVQHLLHQYSKSVVNSLFVDQGYLYVCGDAKNMAKDVNDTLLEIIRNELQLDKLESLKVVAKLREEKRYLQDIWS